MDTIKFFSLSCKRSNKVVLMESMVRMESGMIIQLCLELVGSAVGDTSNSHSSSTATSELLSASLAHELSVDLEKEIALNFST